MTFYIYRGAEGQYVYVPVAEAEKAMEFYEEAGYTVEV